MNEKHAVLVNEIRYSERLTQRTARMYRHAATLLTFVAVVGGSGMVASVSAAVPDWLRIAGGILFAVAAGLGIAIRPVEKAVANEADARKYAALRTKSVGLTAEQLDLELQKARESDVPEVELLRDVVYNDVVTEVGRPDLCQPLSARQKLVSVVA